MAEDIRERVRGWLSAAKATHDHHLTVVDVLDFGDGEAPVRVYARKPTIKDKTHIRSKSLDEKGRECPFEQAVWTVQRLAMDETGQQLFSLEHLQFLRTQVDAELIEGLAMRLYTGASFELVKKN